MNFAMPKQYTQEDVLTIIRKEVAASSLRRTAQRIGISAMFLSHVLNNKKAISDSVAEAFGFEREVIKSTTFRFRKKAA